MGSVRVDKSRAVGLKPGLIGCLSFVAGLSVGIAISTVGWNGLVETVGKAAQFEKLALFPPLLHETSNRGGTMDTEREEPRPAPQAYGTPEGAGRTDAAAMGAAEKRATRDDVVARTRLLQQPLRIVQFTSNRVSPDGGLDSAQHLAAVTRDIQRELRHAGCSLRDVDGSWGQASQAAMRSFLRNVNATLPIDQPDIALLSLLRSYDGRACGKGCVEASDLDGQCPNLQSAARAAGKGIVTGSTAGVQTRRANADDSDLVTAPSEPRWTVMIQRTQAVPSSTQAYVQVPDVTYRDRSSATRMTLGAPPVNAGSQSVLQPVALGPAALGNDDDDASRVAARAAERASSPATRPARPATRTNAAPERERGTRRASYGQRRPSWQERAFAVEN